MVKANGSNEERDCFIFGYPVEYVNHVVEFQGMSLQTLQTLIDKGYINPDSPHEHPTVQDYLDFLENHPDSSWSLNGFTHEYLDCGVTITGCAKSSVPTIPEIKEFVACFRDAPELVMNEDGIYCRYF